jgi:hypothetical protein
LVFYYINEEGVGGNAEEMEAVRDGNAVCKLAGLSLLPLRDIPFSPCGRRCPEGADEGYL